MSNIKFTQISETELAVQFAPDTPIEMVQELTKSLLSKGLVEDSSISTITDRYYYKPQDKANTVADNLIKSLNALIKDDNGDNTWHMNKPGAGVQHNRRQTFFDEQNRAKRSAAALQTKMRQTSNILNKPINTKKTEDEEDDVEKSGYGPKGSGLYNPADNARRKSKNTGDQTGIGPNVNTKQYTTIKPAGSQTDPKLKRPQPVKTFTQEEKDELARKMGLKKSWSQHLPFPNAEQEMAKLAKALVHQKGDQALANQLADLMMGKNMLGKDVHPAVRAMMVPPPSQPTDEQLFGHLVASEEMIKNAEQEWSGTLNNFYLEASRPLSQRFASEEEEIAYWSNIKVSDRDDGKSGY
jgi:hypothetical protein